MNANELADELEEDVKWTVALNTSLPERLIQASFLLRQQQAEIDSLKDKLMLVKQSLEIVESWTKK
jgi:P2-related tail formation protein